MSQRVDPAGVLAFVDAVDADPNVELHGLMVLRHGHVVAEGWWAPHTAERTRLVYSLSKSFTSTALAFAADEGLVDLDDTVLQHFPEYADEVTDPRSRSLTLRHLISMASGHDRDMWGEAVARDREDPVRGFLLMPPEAPPGSVFAYSQPCTYTVAAVIQRLAGQRLSEYLGPRLLEPLGIDPVAWFSMPPGREQGFSGLFARTEDVAKLGQLYLQRGRWDGQQLIPESYVAQATSRAVATADADEGKVDWSQGYGYGFWMSRHGYRGDGAFGQFCLVLPEQDAVVAITGGTEAMQTVLDHVWEHLLPSLGGGTEVAEDAHPRLVERLRTLGLPPCPGTPSPPRLADWSGTTFSVVDSSAAASTLSSVVVETAHGSVGITLHEPDNALTFAAGAGEWLVSEPSDASGDGVPVAASAGWIGDDTLRVEAIFLETPHRLDVECSLSTGTARATWRGTPLDGGRLKRLHRPR
ncbi:serine hydrolase domain-containing protein [Nocardioides pinisoli]|uniref:Beta-lactamase family protein n=1 Tax=Nocardioides pinisoli TaxID=2950279 RepID=A0ABT1L0Y7_9ACTN|nr:serine hydrolase domain-containing protein [Nocardioides pinisoli]MCP3423161.1 beta-lactamase family protein [Nocardioides pinisoli]